MDGIKIAIIGAGSTYTPELIEGMIKRKDSLPLREIVLMDIDQHKLGIVGHLAQRMLVTHGIECECRLTEDLDGALVGADFVLAQIRVGKLPARVLDETIPLKYGLIGQETCGIGGFFKALRTVPEILKIAKRMEELCPDAFLINFSNPAGIVSQAVLTHTNIKMLGLCNVPFNMMKSLKERLNLEEATFEYVGLNHLSWITSIKNNGHDYIKEALEMGLNSEGMKNIPLQGFTADLIHTVGAIPSSYMEYYYYKDKKFKLVSEAEETRGQKCMRLEEELLELYQNEELHEKPEQLASRGGANYSECAISLVDAIYNDRGEVHVVNLLNNGCLDFMADDDVVEVCAIIGRDGAKPIKIENFNNPHIEEVMTQVKAYERHTVNAAISGDTEEAMRALMVNPLVWDYQVAKSCFEEMKEVHAAYLPQFR
ncbi:6-phospho-beta-glucosidase [Turicibacter sanguinis]|uniref:family 4 glycosyl hydrolase n=1 Tax=Turicibacter sanguinis TaxID=154288 RepID=UPI0018AAF016|nr:6-phospho-beta-glucosidase [Turicibacter sanguinis]MDB8558428.1 6-phospho-beta-glucosidase [Turicibacter sanguinis]MDB8561224.1 6-phospho-beta-glucosidase [Turicibacter sanguinis]